MLRTANRRRLASAVTFLAIGVVALAGYWYWPHRGASPVGNVVANALSETLPRPSEEIACPLPKDGRPPVVLLAMGQSNAANQGDTRGRSSFGALWYEGHCYAIADPLAGATGSGGSIWSRLASIAGTRSEPRSVIFAVLAVDATSISDWVSRGPLSSRVADLVDTLRARHMTVSAVLWQQGEADSRMGTSGDEYASALVTFIRQLRQLGISSPVLLARSTRCRNSGSNRLRTAVAQVAEREPNVFLGPDTDALGDRFRFDGCHFNDAGLERAAIAWMDVLQQRDIFNAN